jgi:hypothetical protein
MRQPVLFRQHGLHPTLTIGRCEFYDSLQVATCKALARKDLSHFFALALGREIDVTMLDLFQAPPVIMLGPRAEIVTGGLRESSNSELLQAGPRPSLLLV